MTESNNSRDYPDIVVPTPEDITILRVDDDNAERIGELVEQALLRRETPFVKKGASVSFILIREGGGPGGGGLSS